MSEGFDKVIVYYDNGQKELTKILISSFNALPSCVLPGVFPATGLRARDLSQNNVSAPSPHLGQQVVFCAEILPGVCPFLNGWQIKPRFSALTPAV